MGGKLQQPRGRIQTHGWMTKCQMEAAERQSPWRSSANRLTEAIKNNESLLSGQKQKKGKGGERHLKNCQMDMRMTKIRQTFLTRPERKTSLEKSTEKLSFRFCFCFFPFEEQKDLILL